MSVTERVFLEILFSYQSSIVWKNFRRYFICWVLWFVARLRSNCIIACFLSMISQTTPLLFWCCSHSIPSNQMYFPTFIIVIFMGIHFCSIRSRLNDRSLFLLIKFNSNHDNCITMIFCSIFHIKNKFS